jgi:23S rRNA pseudouridine1911/1915/1917 synthase
VLVINKPRNLVVHPAPGHPSGTLLNGILCHLDEDFLADQDGSVRPGIVHRLDKDTSGLMIVAKTAYAMSFLSEQFSSRSTYKEYLAVVRGKMATSHGTIDINLIRDPKNRQKYTTCKDRGKNAVTDYFVEKKWPEYTLVKLVIHTGRTHQIRVHMKSLGHPVAGDPIYGKTDPDFPNLALMLHSSVLKIMLPGETVLRTFSSEIPEDMRLFMQELDNQS